MYVNSNHKKAQALLDEGKLDASLNHFNKALKESPNHPDIHSHRGVVYLHLNQKKKCLDDLKFSLKLEPDNPYRYASLAYAKDHFGDLEGAITDYQKAVELDPEDAVAHNNLGLLLEKQGYQSKAQRNFEKADKLSRIEKKMFDKLDEIEGEDDGEDVSATHHPQGERLQPRKLYPDEVPTKKEIVRDVLTKKTVFKEFILFVRNGFKLKNDDQKRES
jgi:tetratricopeptide (TPR) repeat protein